MKQKWGITIVTLVAVLVLAAATAGAQADTDRQTAARTGAQAQAAQMTGSFVTNDEDEIVVSESIKAFIDKGKPIGHVIIGLLFVALFFVGDQMRVHWLEKLRGSEIYKSDPTQMNASKFEELVERGGKSRVGRLLKDAGGMFRRSHDAGLISSEAEFYRDKEEHRFNTFESRMAFLADTAGGLGLLGTVWGIYRGFAAKAGAQSNDDLLAAMGIALVTTFMGIVVSVIINWMSTEMGAAFRARIMAALEKVEDYREMLVNDLGRAV